MVSRVPLADVASISDLIVVLVLASCSLHCLRAPFDVSMLLRCLGLRAHSVIFVLALRSVCVFVFVWASFALRSASMHEDVRVYNEKLEATVQLDCTVEISHLKCAVFA